MRSVNICLEQANQRLPVQLAGVSGCLGSCLSHLAFQCRLIPLSYLFPFLLKHQLCPAAAAPFHCRCNCVFPTPSISQITDEFHVLVHFLPLEAIRVLAFSLLLSCRPCVFPPDVASPWPTVQQVMVFPDLLAFAGGIPREADSEMQLVWRTFTRERSSNSCLWIRLPDSAVKMQNAQFKLHF